MKKFMTLLLTFALCMGLVVPASAGGFEIKKSNYGIALWASEESTGSYTTIYDNGMKAVEITVYVFPAGTEFTTVKEGVFIVFATNINGGSDTMEASDQFYVLPESNDIFEIYVMDYGTFDTETFYVSSSNGADAEPEQPAEPAPVAPVAAPTSSPVLVNGKTVSFDAYNISDNNYFKLRDLAYVLSGSEKQFEVTWDAKANAISLISGQSYTEVGGEMADKGDAQKEPVPTTSVIYLDGVEISLTAYNIDGNNYFKLRDLGEALDFEVDWDSVNRTIVIDTAKGYTPD